MHKLAIIVVCAVLAVTLGVSWALSGSGVNVSERLSADLGTEADCYDAGIEEVAGEREEVYECSYTYDHAVVRMCVAVADGDIYVVRTAPLYERLEC